MRPGRRDLLRPDRVREVERPFAWLPCSLLSSGLLGQMSREAKLLYPFLALAADQRGISFWGDPRIQAVLGLSASELQQARGELTALDLLAFDGRTYQLLSLPRRPRAPRDRTGPENIPPPPTACTRPQDIPERPTARTHPDASQPPRTPAAQPASCPSPDAAADLPDDVRAILRRILGDSTG